MEAKRYLDITMRAGSPPEHYRWETVEEWRESNGGDVQWSHLIDVTTGRQVESWFACQPPAPNTIEVRVAVAVAPDGDWSASGWKGQTDDDLKGYAIENLDSDIPRVSMVTARVPLPETAEVRGRVE